MEILEQIITLVKQNRGIDFSGCRRTFIRRRIEARLGPTGLTGYEQYLSFLRRNPSEIDHLIRAFTINVSSFFRDTLVFECLADRIFPRMLIEKNQRNDPSLRVWSAGCAAGEEPYSVAMVLHRLVEKEKLSCRPMIFATDIDEKALSAAKDGLYTSESIGACKYEIVKRYFRYEGSLFRVVSHIREMVTFGTFDLLDKRHVSPPESIFGTFDLILCRNVLIYYTMRHQDRICDHLHRSLAPKGLLVLGEAEQPSAGFMQNFRRYTDWCRIYEKIDGRFGYTTCRF